MPRINGTYKGELSLQGQRVRGQAPECKLTWKGSGNLEVKAGKYINITGNCSGSFNWKPDENCVDRFLEGCASGGASGAGSFPLYSFKVDKLGKAEIALTYEVGCNLEGCWDTDPQTVMLPSSLSGDISIAIGGEGVLKLYKWRRIEVTVWANGSVTITFSGQGVSAEWCINTGGELKLWWLHIEFQKSWCWPKEASNLWGISIPEEEGPVETIKFSVVPPRGSAAIYGPNAILADPGLDLLTDELPSVAADAHGHTIAVWGHGADPGRDSTGQTIWYAVWDGNTWAVPKPIMVEDGHWHTNPAVTYVADSNALVAWARARDIVSPDSPPEEFLSALSKLDIYASIWDGDGWNLPVAITSDDASHNNPALAADHAGHAMLVWDRDADGDMFTAEDSEIYYATWDGTAWGAPQPLTSNDLADSQPDVAYSANGDAMAVWIHDMDGDAFTFDDAELFYSRWRNGSWSYPAPVTNNTQHEANPSIAFDSAGRGVVVWDADGKIYYSLFIDSTWTPPEQINDSLPDANTQPIVATAGGSIAVTWQNYSDEDKELYYSLGTRKENRIEWTGPQKLTDNVIVDWQHCMAVDSKRNVVLVWLKHGETQDDDDDLYYLSWPLPPPSIPVGGIVIPTSKFDLLAPWLGLAALIMVTVVAAVARLRRG
jgi:hypothetical protein